MLEILSHQYLKKFVISQKIDWKHIYSFGRIISKCIKNNSTYLINSEIFFTNDWVSVIMIPLFLREKNSIFVLTEDKIKFFKNNQIEELKTLGFKFVFENDQIVFQNHRVRLLTIKNLLENRNNDRFKNQRIVLSGIENIKQDLKNYFRIILNKRDWVNYSKQDEPINKEIIHTYNFFKKKFFSRKVLRNNYVFLNEEDICFLSNFFSSNSSFSVEFLKVSNALSEGWACWVKLDNINLEWEFYLEPINALTQLKELLTNNKFIFLSALRKDNFFQNYLKKQKINIDLVIDFKSNFIEKEIYLYAPPKQMLPNNPLFNEAIVEKCKKLIIFRKGLTLILLDDIDFKKKLATEFASKYGKRVLLETIPCLKNEILFSSYEWWIKHCHLIQIPSQIIIPLLPIPNMSEPINQITVSYKKNSSEDWFREFFLPEAILKLERSISPLRRNSGKLIILDGRVNKRNWGRFILKSIQPSKEINYMLPFE